MLLYLDDFIIFKGEPTTSSSFPNGGESSQDKATKQYGAGGYISSLEDGVDAAISKVKMKLLVMIIFGINIPFDPGRLYLTR